MKELFIVANWKSHKTISETISWLEEFRVESSRFDSARRAKFKVEEKKIVVCASYALLPDLRSYILDHKLPIKLGAQDISSLDEGSFTGEVNGKQIKECADYVIVGHSERKKYFGETREVVGKKIDMALKHALVPIVCVPDMETGISENLPIVAYEPPTSISPGIPDTPKNANTAAREIKNDYKAHYVLYGGNVTAENVHSFTSQPEIDGVLVGRGSLDAKEFLSIIVNA